jgi:hypothetical protein
MGENAKSKTEIVGDLLLKGTTIAEVLKATGWSAVSMPQIKFSMTTRLGVEECRCCRPLEGAVRGAKIAASRPRRQAVLSERGKKRKNRFGVHNDEQSKPPH